jgi:nitrite reductase/ring-hydroxylating ferredoxin subunit
MPASTQKLVYAADLADLKRETQVTLQLNGHTIALFHHNDQVYAVDNRCPHMGFPLDKGSVQDCILTCHWHHARFDLASGGAFDQFADDVRAFPVVLREGQVWIDIAPHGDPVRHHQERLQVGLERDISLVIAKSLLAMAEHEPTFKAAFRTGLEFGTQYRETGWGQGLTMLVCMMNMLPLLETEDKPRAMYHGLAAVARDCAGHAPRFPIRPLPATTAHIPTLQRWFRQFIEVRDAEGAERCISSAIQAGASQTEMAEMLFAAVTDHRYINVGHPADFTNKALEALDWAGWDLAAPVLASLVDTYARANRMEESNAWRHPIDLVALLDKAFELLPAALETGVQSRRGTDARLPANELVDLLLADNPQATLDAMLAALRSGVSAEELAGTVAHAAARRIVHFHTSNEFGDWDTALHTFTYANAIHQAVQRAPAATTVRGIFDAAMSIYLDRFLNIPAARVPASRNGSTPDNLLQEFTRLLNQQHQVNQAAQIVVDYLARNEATEPLLATLGALLLREDRDFHTIQAVEAALRQYALQQDPAVQRASLIAAARYLAAHAPTMRAQGQTYQIAQRLHRGEALFAETA